MKHKGAIRPLASRYQMRRALYMGRQIMKAALPTRGHDAPGANAAPAPDPAIQEEIQQLKEMVMRQRSEFDNFRKRTQREKDQMRELAAEGVLTRILPVLDNLDRALASSETAMDIESVREGVKMISAQLNRALAGEGLQPVASLHELFDPTRHDALSAEERSDVAEGHICEVLLPGYMYKEKLLRPAMVKVAKRAQQ